MSHRGWWALSIAYVLLFVTGLLEAVADGETGVGLVGVVIGFVFGATVLAALPFVWRRRWWPHIPTALLVVAGVLIVGGLYGAAQSHTATQTGAPGAPPVRRLSITGDDSGIYVPVRLPHSVVISVPRNWDRLSENATTTIAATAIGQLARAGLVDATGDLQFAANLYSNEPHRTMALVNVRFYPDQDVTQVELRGLSAPELAEINRELERGLRASVAAGGNNVLAWHATERIEVNGLAGLLYGYERTSPNAGTFRARMLRVLDGPRSFTVTASYATDLGVLLEPITDYMLSSVRKQQ